jgi:hypothetical protein
MLPSLKLQSPSQPQWINDMPLINVIGLSGGAGGGAAPAFSPADLFAGGENGVWYHPQDPSSIFSSQPVTRAAGTWGSAAADRAAIMVDKRLLDIDAADTFADWLSARAELLSNPSMNTDTAWTKGTGVTHTGTGYAFDGTSGTTLTQACGIAANSWYAVEVVVSAYTSGTARVLVGSSGNSDYSINGVGTFLFFFKASGNTEASIQANTSGPFTGTIDSMSVKHVPGNHAYSINDTNRGTLRQDANSIFYVEFTGTAYMTTDTSRTDIMAADSVVLCSFLAYDDTQYSCPWSFDSTTRINFGNRTNGTYTQTLYNFTTQVASGWVDADGDDNTLNTWEVYLNDTSDQVTIAKNDTTVQAATSYGSAWGTGILRIANANNSSQPLTCDWYGLVIYEGSSFDQDVYDWMQTEIGLGA